MEDRREKAKRGRYSQVARTNLGLHPLFEIQSLVFQYSDGQKALNGIDLEIFPGDRIALVGQNGAGKTTLVKHLNGLYRPGSGTVLYKGKPLDGEHLTSVRPQIGMLFQDPDDQLFCNTLDEDVAFGPYNQGLDREEIEARVLGSLRKVDLEQLRFKAPHHLSYGQKKRAALATLLSMSPEVLILDEPTANLDPKQEQVFVELIREFSGTLICISHDLPFLYGLCSRAVVLERGEIHHDFSMKELVSHRAYLREHGLDFTFRLSCCQDNGGSHEHSHEHNHQHTHERTLAHSGHYTISIAARREDAERRDTPPAHALIQLQDYTYRYPDGTWGIREAEISVAEGDSVAIVGENGAGKSTLVSCLAGILEGDGEYAFDGKPVLGRFRKELWRHIGLVFQDPSDQLFCPSCLEEVAFGPKQLGLDSAEINARVEEALVLVRLTGFESRVPHQLSAGERKRVALAAVLSMRPRVLILDEPTANLDPQSEELFCEILQQLNITKILISHDIDIISLLCARTIVMHGGKLIRDYPTAVFSHDEHLISINGLDYTFKNACCREIMRLQAAF